MQKNGSYRLWSARLLVFVFVAMWSLKMGHALLAHHEHADRPTCEVATEHQGTHLHDERYAGEDCSLCAFVLAIPDVFSVSALISPAAQMPDSAQPLLFENPYIQTAFDTTTLRGPPAAM
ncbi:MAG: hypothetical protein IT262_06575 [Saprospiraceae bacterium]|nr:hypothetical protein [Saprospiraceae bacterium]